MQLICQSSIAKASLHLGDVSRGFRIVNEIGDPSLYLECGEILEGMDQMGVAANLYVLGNRFEKAAGLYMDLGDFQRASDIMGKVTLPRLQTKYGTLCEKEGEYILAVESYKRANDAEGVVRIYLNNLDDPDKAYNFVRESQNLSASLMVANYFEESDHERSIELYLKCNQSKTALTLAKDHSCVDIFSRIAGQNISLNDAEEVGSYYEQQNEPSKAASFYKITSSFEKAVELYLMEGSISEAIAVIGQAKSEKLTHQMIDFLMGSSDGTPKHPRFVYELYIALGDFSEAADTATIIAEQEQADGDYESARKIVYETITQLDLHCVPVPRKLQEMFVLFHSYHLAKIFAKRGDHYGAARMLLRVSQHISKFPKHQVQILISTIIECQKCGHHL